jgi:adenylosuccinate lyase
MLHSFGEIEEPFGKEQIGSSAMAYKRNPMRSERINSLARFVQTVAGTANQTHQVQYFERTLDDSAIRRLTIPEAFLATDAILILMENVTSGLEVHPARIAARIAEELPFMATESLIVQAVKAGGDRQEAHEVIRRHSIAAARAMKDEGISNDLLDRLAADPAFPVSVDAMRTTLEPSRFIGRAASARSSTRSSSPPARRAPPRKRYAYDPGPRRRDAAPAPVAPPREGPGRLYRRCRASPARDQ